MNCDLEVVGCTREATTCITWRTPNMPAPSFWYQCDECAAHSVSVLRAGCVVSVAPIGTEPPAELMTEPEYKFLPCHPGFTGKGASNVNVRCDMDKTCMEPVTMLDRKGYAYCTVHGMERRTYQPCRKLRKSELAKLHRGETLARY